MTLQRGDVVLVPFPFTDLMRQKARPAVVISSERFNASSADVVLVAISSRLPASPNDTDFILQHGSTGFQATGLRVSSVIRTTKLVTLQQSLIYTTLGKLDSRLIDELDGRLARAVGLQALGDEITAPSTLP
jgi:mRNA interferase MazF